MKAQPIILLLKNHSVVATSDIDSYYTEIQYIMVKADEQLGTFVLLEPNNILRRMTKAEVKFESVVNYSSYITDKYDTKTSPFGKVKKTVNGVAELIQYIHSLNRISYINDIMVHNDSPEQLRIYFLFFKIKIYDKNDKCIFKFKKQEDMRLITPKIILDKLAIFYNPTIIKYNSFRDCSKNLNVNIDKHVWTFSHKAASDCAVGIPLVETSSYTFFAPDDIKLIKDNLRCLYCQTYVYDKNITNETDLDDIHKEMELIDVGLLNGKTSMIWMFDYWAKTYHMLIEYITYLPYLYVIIQTTNEVNDSEDGEPTYRYRSVSYFNFDWYNRPSVCISRKDVSCTNTTALSMTEVIDLIKETIGD